MALSDDAVLLAYVRSWLPALDSNDVAYLSNDTLDYIYANKAGSDADKTIAWALRQMCVLSSLKVSQSNSRTGDSKQYGEARDAICKQADSYANLVGINTGQIGTATTGTINLGIDEEDSTFNIT